MDEPWASPPPIRAGPKHDCVAVLRLRLYVGGHGGVSRFGMAGSSVFAREGSAAATSEQFLPNHPRAVESSRRRLAYFVSDCPYKIN
jgi:hypothetical protein